MGADLHQGFREPARAPASELSRFLEQVDRLPGIRTIRSAMRDAVALQPGTRLLDAGCGNGIEAARLARQHPRALVTGLDRNVELLREAPRADLARGRPARSPAACPLLRRRADRACAHVRARPAPRA